MPTRYKNKMTGAIMTAPEILEYNVQQSPEHEDAYRAMGADELINKALAKGIYEPVTEPPTPPNGATPNGWDIAKNAAKDLWDATGGIPYNIAKGAVAVADLKSKHPGASGFIDAAKDVGSSLYQDFKNYYVGKDAEGRPTFLPKERFAEHPLRPLADASVLFGGAEGGARLADAAGVAGADSVANAARTASIYTNPTTLLTQGAQKVANLATKSSGLPEWLMRDWVDSSLRAPVDYAHKRLNDADISRLSKAAVNHGIRPNQGGLDRATDLINTIQEAREGAAKGQSVPVPGYPSTLRLGFRPLIEETGDNPALSAHSVIGDINSQLEDILKGALIDKETGGELPVPNRPKRVPDRSLPAFSADGEQWLPVAKTTGDLFDDNKAINKTITSHLESLAKNPQKPPELSSGSMQALRKTGDVNRTILDQMLGDIPVSLNKDGKVSTYRFKDLGLNERDLMDLRDRIVAFANSDKKLHLTDFKSPVQATLKTIKYLIGDSPEFKAAIGKWIADKNPTPLALTRAAGMGSVVGQRLGEPEPQHEYNTSVGVSPEIKVVKGPYKASEPVKVKGIY